MYADEVKTIALGILVCSVICGGLVTCALVAERSRPKDTHRVYHMKYGTAYCGESYVQPCGVRLEHCTDDRTYVCLQDVMCESEAAK